MRFNVGDKVRIIGNKEVYRVVKVDRTKDRYELQTPIGVREIGGKLLELLPQELEKRNRG